MKRKPKHKIDWRARAYRAEQMEAHYCALSDALQNTCKDLTLRLLGALIDAGNQKRLRKHWQDKCVAIENQQILDRQRAAGDGYRAITGDSAEGAGTDRGRA